MERMALLVLDGVFDSGLAVVLDALEAAQHLAPALGRRAPFEVVEAGVRARVRSHHGRPLRPVKLDRARAEVLFVPGLAVADEDALESTLERTDVREAIEQLKQARRSGAFLAAACSSTFLLAEAGVLDGRAATTTWWLAPAFRRRYPRITLDESQMVVESKHALTAGAALGHLDAALTLLHNRSPKLARVVAERLVVEPRPSQAPFIVPSFLARADPLVERFEGWVRARLSDSFNISEAARAIGAGERTLERRVKGAVGRSPLQFVQDIRVERAAHLLRTTRMSLDEVAGHVGYASGISIGVLLRRRLGRGARELRSRR